ncbi:MULTISPECIES: PadR family transcriptional regulator [Brevibacillus]|uniref:PadR family transcriptional regulator n=1 Tax=Brevibacillus TaxID=55080 RepID=UPI001C8EB9A6|nr:MULTISPECIES: PadR family transcriptional regulator [Brevibacillus]MBY0085636.1 helix-turn-helix transcriptional regulator [Brevibacillus brevis]MCE0449980.1 helix-turn-helix transcriptional regulator [Brevibacillus sp. AF8]UKK97335.1 PadR family transcriptional regulator [Brevibacillus brevis]
MKINKELLKGSTVILILTMLDRKEMYGYEIAKAIEKESNGLFTLKEGTLYPILHALEAERYVEAYWDEKDGRKRKYYRITAEGCGQLKEKKHEWHTFRDGIDRVLGEGRA